MNQEQKNQLTQFISDKDYDSAAKLIFDNDLVLTQSVIDTLDISDFLRFFAHGEIFSRLRRLRYVREIENEPGLYYLWHHKNKTKEQRETAKRKDIYVHTIESFWDEKFFTPERVRREMMIISSREYPRSRGKETLKEGILLKKAPYEEGYWVNVFGFTGDMIWEASEQRAYGSKLTQIGQILRYKKFPTKRDLKNDFAAFDFLQTLEPIGELKTDTGVFPVYPTALEVGDKVKAAADMSNRKQSRKKAKLFN